MRVLTGLMSAFLLLLALASVTARAQEKPKLARVIEAAGAVSANGLWRPDNPTKKNELGEAVSEIICYPHGGKELVLTEAFCLEATATTIEPDAMLDVTTRWLKVVEWSGDQLIAVDDLPICLTSQTIFDLKRKTVMSLDVRKPEARGLLDVCTKIPDRQTYYLQDKNDYYGRKWAGGGNSSGAK